MRTGKIGLNSFLFNARVQDVPTPLCSCGTARETAFHMATECQIHEPRRQGLLNALAPRALRTMSDFTAALHDPSAALTIVRWTLRLNRLQSYRLANRIHAPGPLRPHREDAARERRKQREDSQQNRHKMNSLLVPPNLLPHHLRPGN